jgi:hypothetical protein
LEIQYTVSVSATHTSIVSYAPTASSCVRFVFVVCVVDFLSFSVVVVRVSTVSSMNTTLVFPTPVLTPIVGRPTNTTLQILQQQLYQNARAIACPLGGGALGHLAVIMEPVAYVLRPTAAVFNIPVSPGVLTAPPRGADAAAIDEHKRVYKNDTMLFTTYQAVRTALTNQIIAAVEPTYLQALNDIDFGFSDVQPYAMLTHLKTTYGVLTGLEIEKNRARLSDAWDTSSPIETLWARISEIRRIATNANQDIGDTAVIALVLPMFERTGLFTHSINAWNGMDLVGQTYDRFMTHFTRANELRITALTSADLKFADANAATYLSAATQMVTPPRINNTGGINNRTDTGSVSVSGNRMYYCWSHGLGSSEKHTGHTCKNTKPGHIADATAFRRQGGSNIFYTREDLPPRHSPRNSTLPAT